MTERLQIPRVFHRVWPGLDPLPADFVCWGETWLKNNPGWEMKLWTPRNMPRLRNRRLYDESDTLAVKSDIARLEIMLRFGGVYVDTDYECFKNIEPLLADYDHAFVYEPVTPIVSNAFFAATPNHPLIRLLSEGIAESWRTGHRLGHLAGPEYYTRSLEKQSGVVFLPISSVMPYKNFPVAERQRRGPTGDAYAAHYWAAGGRWTIRRAPCGNCQEPERRADLGIMSYLRAKFSGPVSEMTRLRRLTVCRLCQEIEAAPDMDLPGVRLFREIGATPFCGRPRALIERRDERAEGCGCDLHDKTLWRAAACPHGHWGPGDRFAQWIRPVTTRAVPINHGIVDVVQGTREVRPDHTGLGDCLMNLPLVHAAARAWPEKRVRFVILGRYAESWARLGWGDVVCAQTVTETGARMLFTPHRMLAGDLLCEQRQMTRLQLWAEGMGVLEHLQPIKLRVPPDAQLWAAQELREPLAAGRPIICFAPFVNSTARSWPLHHWLELVELLKRTGATPILLDGSQRARSEMFPCMRYWGYGGPETAALLQHAQLFIGADSGLTHLAGLLGLPALAVCGPTNGRWVFGSWPSVEVMQGAPCGGCMFQADRGWHHACGVQCGALWDLRPADVAQRALARLAVSTSG
jgi:hypothetical protein